MTVTAKAARRQRRDEAAAKPSPQPTALLAWYDRHRRKLPWRAAPGERADPYHVWLSEIMLQQTTVKAVAPYYARFLARWPMCARSPRRRSTMCCGFGPGSATTPARATCTPAPAPWSSAMADNFPASEAELRALPGIGAIRRRRLRRSRSTRRASPVDGNIERVIARLYAVDEPLPAAKPAIQRRASGAHAATRAGDFAQAMMDLGATICTPKKPACALCPWNDACVGAGARQSGDFPIKTRKGRGQASPRRRFRRGARRWFRLLVAPGRPRVCSAA